MKNIFKIAIIFIVLFSLSSCRDESLNPLLPYQVKIGLIKAEIIKPESPIIEMDPEEQNLIDILLESPEGNVDSYTLKGKVKILGEWTEYKDIATVTEFPVHLMLSAEDILTGLGLEASDIPNYSKFYFLGTSISNGVTVDLSTVVGAGFSPDDNPDGVSSGLTAAYIERKHLLKF